MGLAGAAVSARADARRWGGRTFRRSFYRNAAWAAGGAAAGRTLAGIYRGVGAARYRAVVRYRFGRRHGRIRFGRKIVRGGWHGYRPAY